LPSIRANAARTIGGTGTALGKYMKVQDAFLHGDLDDRTINARSYMAIRRREIIEAARADEFHWRRVLNPCERIDVDMLAPGLCLKNRAIEYSATSLVRERGEIAAIPFETAAKLSRPEQGLNPGWR
jgi:hypothetical protein